MDAADRVIGCFPLAAFGIAAVLLLGSLYVFEWLLEDCPFTGPPEEPP